MQPKGDQDNVIGAILYKKLSISNLQLNYSRFADLLGRNNLPAVVNNRSSAYQIVKCYRGERNNLFIIHCSKSNYMEWHQLPINSARILENLQKKCYAAMFFFALLAKNNKKCYCM